MVLLNGMKVGPSVRFLQNLTILDPINDIQDIGAK
jgi:hypothetical protein